MEDNDIDFIIASKKEENNSPDAFVFSNYILISLMIDGKQDCRDSFI